MIINKRTMQGYENTKIVRYDNPESLNNKVLFKDLPNREVKGVLKINRYVDGELTQVYSSSDNHVGVIAATRLGKTTSYVVPTVLSFAMQKTKKSMIISDPKGEVYRYTAETLRRQGYKVKLLNFRNYSNSECWNPITPIFRKYRSAAEIYDEVGLVKTKRGYRNVFRGTIYDDQKELNDAVELAQRMTFDEVGDDIDKIAALFMPSESQKEPYWEDAARELLKAFLWAMLEDSDKKENPITEDTFSFSTIISLQLNIHAGRGIDFNDGGYFTERDHSTRSYKLIKDNLLVNGDVTRACILSTFNTKMAIFRECAMRLITSCNSFGMDVLTDGPTAVFIDYRDELNVHYKLISLFVQDATRYLVDVAENDPSGKLKTPVYVILDEFGNLPKVNKFDATVSSCGGRNLYFILILQSYAQLKNVYGDYAGDIIKDNLNIHVFMGSNNPDTLEAFSRECGKLTRISPVSAFNGDKEEIEQFQIETIPAVPQSVLAHLDPGECVVTEANCGYVLFSKLERFYLIDEMNDLPLSSVKDYKGGVNPFDKKYAYIPDVKPKKSSFDF